MKKRDWMSCDNPSLMLEFSKGRLPDQLLRAFALACGRRVLGIADEPYFERLLTFGENRANDINAVEEDRLRDELAKIYSAETEDQEIPSAKVLAMSAIGDSVFMRSAFDAAKYVSETAAEAVGTFDGEQVNSLKFDEAHDAAFQGERAGQATMLRNLCSAHANMLFDH